MFLDSKEISEIITKMNAVEYEGMFAESPIF